MRGAIPPFPNTPSWRGVQLKAVGQLYIYLYLLGLLFTNTHEIQVSFLTKFLAYRYFVHRTILVTSTVKPQSYLRAQHSKKYLRLQVMCKAYKHLESASSTCVLETTIPISSPVFVTSSRFHWTRLCINQVVTDLGKCYVPPAPQIKLQTF
jgi:hypothetical protein